eukprot:UN06845
MMFGVRRKSYYIQKLVGRAQLLIFTNKLKSSSKSLKR